MPTATYTPLANVTLGATASTVTFSSIPATYRDLVLIAQVTSDTTQVDIRFNTDSGSNYNRVYAVGDGSVSASTTSTNSTVIRLVGTVAADPTTALILRTQIMDYSATNKHKSVLHRSDNSANGTFMLAGRWANTAAITTVAFLSGVSPFKAGNTFALYGIIS